MEIRGEDQNDIRSAIPTSYGLMERRREGSGGGGNNNNSHHNGSTTSPPTTNVLTYTQTLDYRSFSVGSKRAHERYRECLRNHAASVGGNVYDGCGEFMPGGDEGTLEALKCAACDCHRNFHRKETDAGGSASSHRRRGNSNSTPIGAPTMVHSLQLPAISYHHPHHHQHHHQRLPPVVQPMSVAFGGNDSGSSEELNLYGHSNKSNAQEHQLGGGGINAPPPPPYVLSKKRFRTKFTVEQKEKMMEFAAKIEWRINRQDEGEVDRFCEEVGVRRQVFKVWMHNNKNLRTGGSSAGGASQDEQDQPLLQGFKNQVID